MKKKKAKKTYPKIGRKSVRSEFEFTVYNQLMETLPADSEVDYETDKLHYYIEGDYNPDFTIKLSNGIIIYIEVKGAGRSFDAAVQKKMIAVKTQHPDKDIRFVFYRNAPLRTGSKFRQSDWAEKHGFIYAIGDVPPEWFEVK